MSSKKDIMSTAKFQEDENTDSGFLSGPLSEQLLSSEDCGYADESDSKVNVAEPDPYQLDSGLDLCLSECLSNVNLSDSSSVPTPTAQSAPSITVEDKTQDYPPLVILFQQDDDGDTQLHIAAVHGCEKSVGTLIRVCPEKAWFDVPNDFGQTALHLAALSGQAVVTRMLVRAGATLGVRDLAGDTPLHVAAAAGYLDCLQALLAPVPEHSSRRLAATLNQKNYNGQTCIHLAARAGHVEALQALVFYGADINAREGLCGWTALHIAAGKGDVAMSRYLLERCAGVARSARDYAGRSARRLARRTAAYSLFAAHHDSSDSDSESDDETLYDSDQSLFDRLREGMNAINVS